MVTEQETLIYIEDKDKLDASVAANSFAHKDVKNRAYINTLGAELALKYLASEDIDVSGIYNIHSIKKILEEMDISDIMLPNIHIDVRVVFDENVIFVPKSHFEYNLVPDIYLVFCLAKDFSHVKFLGFFEPKLINKNNANDKYYFIEKEKLSSAKDLKKYIEEHNGNTAIALSDEDLSNSEQIIISMADNDISEEDKKYLISQLTKSSELRDKFIEYENFETLSYKAMTDDRIHKKSIEQIQEKDADTTILSDETILPDEADETVGTIDDLDLEPIEDIESIKLDDSQELNTEPTNETTEPTSDGTGISGAIAGAGLAAGVIAGAAAAGAIVGETIGATEGIAATTDTISNIADIVDTGVDLAQKSVGAVKDLLTDDTTEINSSEISETNENSEDTISFEDIDTSALDGTITDENIISDETISLNDVDISDENSTQEIAENSDDTISFDDVQPLTENTEELDLNTEEEPISFENIDTSVVDNITTEDFNDETVAIDSLETTKIPEDVQIDENSQENLISLDNLKEEEIPSNSEENEEENEEEKIVSLDETNSVEVEPLQDNSDFMDDELTLDDIDTTTQENDLDSLDNLPEINQISDTQEPEIVENATKQETFGNNLLENLEPENLDDISLDDLNLDDIGNNSEDINSDDISSEDLLSQIDDVLNSSATADFPIENTETIDNSTETNNFNETPEIPEITDTEVSEIDSNQTSDISSDVTENADIETNSDEVQTDDDALIADINDLLGNDSSNNNEEENQNSEDFETETTTSNESDDIGMLFNDTDPVTDSELDNIEETQQEEYNPEQTVPGAALFNKKKSGNKNTMIVAAALITVLAATSAVMVFKPKQDTSADVEPIVPNTTAKTENQTETADNLLDSNTPSVPQNTIQEVKKAPQTKELKNTAIPARPKQSSNAYIDVSKLVWDVPSNLSYSPNMQNYLRTAGKSIKLSLSADLLLADEYAYTNQVKVGLKVSKDGAVQDARILSSSGSTQIDNIVLQSVKNTLNVLKPPSSEIKTPDFNLSLIIYF